MKRCEFLRELCEGDAEEGDEGPPVMEIKPLPELTTVIESCERVVANDPDVAPDTWDAVRVLRFMATADFLGVPILVNEGALRLAAILYQKTPEEICGLFGVKVELLEKELQEEKARLAL